MSRATLVLALVAAAAEMIGAETAPSCLAYRSFETPVPQPNLKNCPQFRDMSCCNEDVDSLIIPNENGTQLYGFDWSQCGQLSPACQKFFQAESCYFECDPYMAPWKDRTSANPVAVVNVPVCADYCGAWFEACKNDLTCGDEWMVDFIPHENSEGEVVSYECAPGSQCKTFKDVFHNAQGLCDILWGAAFHYSEDLDNCVRWDFGLTTSNPNRFVEKVDYTQSYCGPKLEPLPEEPPKRSKVEPSCMPGKDLDTPASVKLKECPHFRDEACCSVETDAKIGHKDQDELFFGYNWDQCGPISDKCKRFFQAEACYFHCDPYNYQWANPTVAEPSTYIGVPVCADYCDEWYDACKEEMTCATEWIIGLAPQKNGNGDIVGYECAEGTECKSFAEVFENPRGMCELMWGSYYHYSEDPDNCVRFDFEGKNPNQFVHQTTYSSGSCMMKEVKERNTAAIALGVVLAITFVVLGLFIIFMIFREKASRPLFGSSK